MTNHTKSQLADALAIVEISVWTGEQTSTYWFNQNMRCRVEELRSRGRRVLAKFDSMPERFPGVPATAIERLREVVG